MGYLLILLLKVFKGCPFKVTTFLRVGVVVVMMDAPVILLPCLDEKRYWNS